MGINFFKISKFLLYLAPFAVIIVTPSTLFPFIVGKYTYFKVIIEFALIAFILGWGFNRNFSAKGGSASGGQFSIFNFQLWKQPLVVAVALFVAIFTLAGFTGINPQASFWSNFERGEGSFLMLHFFVFFLLLLLLFGKEEDWKNLFRVSIGASALMALYGVAAAMQIPGFVGNPICERFAGSLGNPAYIGTYSIFAIFYVVYLAVSGNWKSKAWQTWNLPFLVFLGLYFFVFLLLSQTRGGLLGLGVGLIAGLIYLTFSLPSRKWRKVSALAALVLIAMGLLGIYYRKHVNLAPWCSGGGNRILDVAFGGETIQTRFALWGQSIEAWQERPLLGWGPENFSVAFEKHFKPVHTVWFDRAHNIFFDYLVFAGVLGLLSFIGMFITLYWQFFKARTNTDYTRTNTDKKKSELLYEDLTYKIRGIIFKVKKELGLGHKENIYQKAIENELRNNNLIFEKEKSIDIKYGGEKIGIYRPDFIIDNKVILEFKTLPLISKFEKKQIWHYLKGSNYKLALLVNFGRKDVEIERFIYDGHRSSAQSQYKLVSSLYESALLFSLPIGYLVQGLVLFDVLPIYINLFLFLAFASWKLSPSKY